MKTTFDVEILEDGTISVKTSEIDQKDHKAADDFLEMVESLMGGEMSSTPDDFRQLIANKTAKIADALKKKGYSRALDL